MSAVLVTGGAGYVGSHICKALYQEGFQPVVIDNLSRGFRSLVQYGPIIQGDISDASLLRNIYEKYRFHSVVHCAAFAYVGESVEKPELYYDNNVAQTIGFFNALSELNIANIIFSSSCATYGIPEETPIAPSCPQNPINPYGETKLVIEKLIQSYATARDYNYAILRYFNVAGAHPDLEIGELHDPETHLIPLAIRAALDDQYEITIFGDDYTTPDGTCIRDYIHVADLACAHTKALKRLTVGSDKSVILNLGNGLGVSVMQIIEMVQNVTGQAVKYKVGPRREGDPASLIADAQDAYTQLDWSCEYSDLKTMIQTAVAWYRKNESISSNSHI